VQPPLYNSTQEMLTKYSRATYTTCRTFGQTSIVDLRAHIQRLEKVSEILPLPEIPFIALSAFVLPSIRHVVQEFAEMYKAQNNAKSETRLTIVVGIEESNNIDPQKLDDLDVLVFGEELPPPRRPPVIVEVRDGSRHNPNVKSTDWARERKKYQPSDHSVEEVILKDGHSGNLSEGLSSNFGVIKDGKLITAPQATVLSGVTMHNIINCCHLLGIEVMFQHPRIQEVKDWQGAFISSTSRLLMPVDVLRVLGDGKIVEITFHKSDLMHNLKLLFEQELEKSAVSVFSSLN